METRLFSVYTPTATDCWAMNFITSLWVFTRTTWNMRNTILRGATAEETTRILLQGQHDAIRAHYEAFSANPAYLLPRHHHLFNSHSLEQHLHMHYDLGKCLLHSVDEAQQVLLLHDSLLQEASAQFFTDPAPSDTSSSSYTPSILYDDSSALTATTRLLLATCPLTPTTLLFSVPMMTILRFPFQALVPLSHNVPALVDLSPCHVKKPSSLSGSGSAVHPA